jgi:hypothetical protein
MSAMTLSAEIQAFELSAQQAIVLGAESPLFSYSFAEIGTEGPTTIVGADFASTRLVASVFFYTD